MLFLLSLFISTSFAGSTDFVYPLVYNVAITKSLGAATVVSVSKNLNLFSVSRHVWSLREKNKNLLGTGETEVFCSKKIENDYCLIRSPKTPALNYATFSIRPINEKTNLVLKGNGHNNGIRELKGFASYMSKDSYFFHCIPEVEGDSGGIILNTSQKVVAINIGSQQNNLACPGSDHGGRGVSSNAIFEELSVFAPSLLDEMSFED